MKSRAGSPVEVSGATGDDEHNRLDTHPDRSSAASPRPVARPLSVAPMMDWTDRDFRYFFRQISRHTFLYTEMVTTAAILNGDRDLLLGYSEPEKPLALQLGGDNPTDLARCARIAQDYGYDEINLNVGCPSDRVQNGNFGACLMAQPELVAECVAAMKGAGRGDVPVTVKHRIGIDRDGRGRALDRYEDLRRFVATVAGGGCRRFSVHSRIAVLGGLSPRENREVPPLRYEDVFQLKREFPELLIEINGGIRNLRAAGELLEKTDGVMIGRAAYETPWIFGRADLDFYTPNGQPRNYEAPPIGSDPPEFRRPESTGKAAQEFTGPTRRSILENMIPYLESRLRDGRKQHQVLRHMMGLFAGQRGARAYRRMISEREYPELNPEQTIRALTALIDPEILDQPPATAMD
ncbi:MAG: tRNA dihydrouridine(20/20a) synthase DusA [Leptospirales bacterium]|jgi:tRNA-dihydrouridine synthase A